MSDSITEIAEKLSFLGNVRIQYEAAEHLQGAEYLDAAISMLKTAWSRRERQLKAQLETERRGKVQATTTSTAGTKPQRLPTSRAEFDGLPYRERLWIYHNAPEVYNRYTGRLTKKDVMAIKDPQDRQRAIAENISLFL